jgi:4-amino-4-deoxy-L-arabinose transferase-like glycosyltransferase
VDRPWNRRLIDLPESLRRRLPERFDERSRPWAALTALGAVSMPTALALVVVLLLGALPRFANLTHAGLSGDEAVYAGQAALLAGNDEFARYFILVSRGNSNFLLFQYAVGGLFAVFGVNDLVPRLISATASGLTVLVVFEIGRTLYGRAVALAAAFLLAISAYAITLGRVALLDSALTLLVTSAVLFLAKWSRSRRQGWLLAFAAVTALAVQAKVVGVLLLPIAVAFLIISGSWRRVTRGSLWRAALVVVIVMAPAWLQLALGPQRFFALLADSARRVSDVAAWYYPAQLIGQEGIGLPLVWLAGILLAAAWHRRGDLLLLSWLGIWLAFVQVYPLKAFNYLLPIVPAMSLLGARGVFGVVELIARRVSLRRGMPAAALRGMALALLLAIGLQAVGPVSRSIAASQSGGLREAAEWLAANTSPSDGVMTISHGSAQYALAFYARRDAYPFGRFRLATVLPGGVLVQPQVALKGTPRDWVIYWPPRLIEQGVVSYLVYYTSQPDDPPDMPLVTTETQRQFRQLIERYDGQLVHVVYDHHEPRIWIYRVGRLQPQARLAVETISSKAGRTRVTVKGSGYRIGSPISISYHRAAVASVRADQQGDFQTTIEFSGPQRSAYQLLAVDVAGHSALATDVGGRR